MARNAGHSFPVGSAAARGLARPAMHRTRRNSEPDAAMRPALPAQRGASTITIWRPSMRGSDSTFAIGSVSAFTRCRTSQPSC